MSADGSTLVVTGSDGGGSYKRFLTAAYDPSTGRVQWVRAYPGRADRLYPRGRALERGTYKLVYRTAEYFKARGVETFFPTVEVVFEVRAAGEHYHVPLLLGPFGYGTYRGS